MVAGNCAGVARFDTSVKFVLGHFGYLVCGVRCEDRISRLRELAAIWRVFKRLITLSVLKMMAGVVC